MPADFVIYTIVPSGEPISTDKITLGGVLVHLQRMKIGIGPSGSYQQDLSFGAATIANSIPVNIASDQTVPTSNTQLGSLGQTAPTFGSGVLSGQVVAFNYGYHVENNTWARTPIGSGTPLPTVLTNAVLTRSVGPNYTNLGNKATYLSSTNGTISPSGGANTTTSLAYLWHDSSNTKRVTLQKMLITWAAGSGSGDFRLALARITAENGAPGGTSQTICKEDQDDGTSNCTFRTGATGAPTRATGDYVTLNFSVSLDGSIELTDILEGKGFICRASQAEGWEVRFITGSVGPTTTPTMAVTFVWAEQ